MKHILYGILFAALVASGLLGCFPDEFDFTTDTNAKLEFSLDTLRFDTVFTELGSATRPIKIYNRNDKAIRISNISLESGNETRFRMNVDGIPGNTQSDVEVLAEDSIYVFVEVTVNPDDPLSVSPFVIEDRIVFETNGNTQYVHLEAWGQNANYFPSRLNSGVQVRLSCGGGQVVWDDPKPYVIYGIVAINDCELVIPAGARVYVHGGVARDTSINDMRDTFINVFNDGLLFIESGGKLTIKGTKENPVIIQGDRLEESFLDDAGQWNGIVIGRGSRGNVIEYATVRNSRFGILVDSTAQLTARNTQIYNTASSGLIGFHSTITAENCLIYNNGATSVLLTLGGDYDFTYCTLASYGVNASALGMSNFFCYTSDCSVAAQYRLNARFKNSIIFGSQNDEIELADARSGNDPLEFNIQFEDCIVKVRDLLTANDGRYANFFENQCMPCINGDRNAMLFVDANEDDYRLDTLSIAEGMAKPIEFPRPIPIDLEGKNRDASKPDIGCYEREN